MVSPVSLPAESIVTRIQRWRRQRRPPNGPRLPKTRCRQTPTPQGFAESPSARVRARLQPARSQDELCTLVTTFSPCSVTCVIVRRIDCHRSTKFRPFLRPPCRPALLPGLVLHLAAIAPRLSLSPTASARPVGARTDLA